MDVRSFGGRSSYIQIFINSRKITTVSVDPPLRTLKFSGPPASKPLKTQRLATCLGPSGENNPRPVSRPRKEQIHWKVDARKLESQEKQILSPESGMPRGETREKHGHYTYYTVPASSCVIQNTQGINMNKPKGIVLLLLHLFGYQPSSSAITCDN